MGLSACSPLAAVAVEAAGAGRAPCRTHRPLSESVVCVQSTGRPGAPPSLLWVGDGVPCQAFPLRERAKNKLVRLLAVDHSARASMKNAASCEN